MTKTSFKIKQNSILRYITAISVITTVSRGILFIRHCMYIYSS